RSEQLGDLSDGHRPARVSSRVESVFGGTHACPGAGPPPSRTGKTVRTRHVFGNRKSGRSRAVTAPITRPRAPCGASLLPARPYLSRNQLGIAHPDQHHRPDAVPRPPAAAENDCAVQSIIGLFNLSALSIRVIKPQNDFATLPNFGRRWQSTPMS